MSSASTAPGPHVLVARLDNAGDVLLTGPAVRAVRASARRVTFLCGKKGEAAARLLEGVDDVVVASAPWIDVEAGSVLREPLLALVDELGRRGIDQAFIFTSFHQSALPLALLLRMAEIASIAAISDDFPGALLDVRHRVGECHEVERNLSLVATLGYRLPPGDDGRLHVKHAAPPASLPRGYVVVHPGASAPARTLTPRAWAEAVRSLVDAGLPVVVTGGLAERGLTSEVAAYGGTTDLGGQTDLRHLAGILAGAAAVACGNTGPAHLAAAVGGPVVVTFPPTVPPQRWRPWGVRHELLGAHQIPCAGCRARVCPLPHQVCLKGIRPQDVVDAVLRVIADPDAAAPALVSLTARSGNAAVAGSGAPAPRGEVMP